MWNRGGIVLLSTLSKLVRRKNLKRETDYVILNTESTHSKVDAPKEIYLPLNERRLSCSADRGGIIFFSCFSYRERQETR